MNNDGETIQVTYSEVTKELADMCEVQFARIGSQKPDGYFLTCLEKHQSRELVMIVAHRVDEYVGHAKLVWGSDYPGFSEGGIPEIQDLNVLPQYRRRGIATAMIRDLEEIAATRSKVIGIGVGLHPGYNDAQRLYSRLGYVLDGNGVFYDDSPVEMGEKYPFDDALVLHFTKTLRSVVE